MFCPCEGRTIFPLPSRRHLLGRQILVAIGRWPSFLPGWSGIDSPGSLGPWRLFELSSSRHMGTLLFKIYLALSHPLQEKGKMTIPCQTRTHQFQIATHLLVLQSRAQIHFSPWVPWCNILSKQNQNCRPLKVYTWLVFFFFLSLLMRKFKTYKKWSTEVLMICFP